jgi:hypothetical protein
MTRIVLICVYFVAATLTTSAPAATLDHPIPSAPLLRNGETIQGNVTAWDSDGFTIHQDQDRPNDRTVKWDDVSPASAFALRARLIDQKSATDWLDLGEMGWKMNLKDRARFAFSNARRIDPTIQQRITDIIAAQPGNNSNTGSGATTRPHAFFNRRQPTSAPVKYIKSSPEEDAAAIAHAQKMADEISTTMKLKFTELQTPHFIIFTDWDPREFEFLKRNIEDAYGAVSQQFDIPVKENVFVGKLPVFMFSQQNDFLKYAGEYDEMPPNKMLLGYYAGHGDGTGHMAMWKPSTKALGMPGQNRQQMELQWAYTLTHEFTHAFVDRYKSNRPIPRWLNEGLAEVIAQRQFPKPETRTIARDMASENTPIDFLFDDNQMPSGEYYPVMQTMVQMLIDRKNFLVFFDSIKDGMPAEEALFHYYNLTYSTMPTAWRKYAMQ